MARTRNKRQDTPTDEMPIEVREAFALRTFKNEAWHVLNSAFPMDDVPGTFRICDVILAGLRRALEDPELPDLDSLLDEWWLGERG